MFIILYFKEQKRKQKIFYSKCSPNLTKIRRKGERKQQNKKNQQQQQQQKLYTSREI